MPTGRPSNPRWLVYLLRCSDGSLYTGVTNDLPKRLKAHVIKGNVFKAQWQEDQKPGRIMRE